MLSDLHFACHIFGVRGSTIYTPEPGLVAPEHQGVADVSFRILCEHGARGIPSTSLRRAARLRVSSLPAPQPKLAHAHMPGGAAPSGAPFSR